MSVNRETRTNDRYQEEALSFCKDAKRNGLLTDGLGRLIDDSIAKKSEMIFNSLKENGQVVEFL